MTRAWGDDDRAQASWVRQAGRWLWQGMVTVAAALLAAVGILVSLVWGGWLDAWLPF